MRTLIFAMLICHTLGAEAEVTWQQGLDYFRGGHGQFQLYIGEGPNISVYVPAESVEEALESESLRAVISDLHERSINYKVLKNDSSVAHDSLDTGELIIPKVIRISIQADLAIFVQEPHISTQLGDDKCGTTFTNFYISSLIQEVLDRHVGIATLNLPGSHWVGCRTKAINQFTYDSLDDLPLVGDGIDIDLIRRLGLK